MKRRKRATKNPAAGKVGRPRLGDSKRSSTVRVRVTPAVAAQVAAAAAAEERTVSDWGLSAIEQRLASSPAELAQESADDEHQRKAGEAIADREIDA
jgi:hypothetical protein